MAFPFLFLSLSLAAGILFFHYLCPSLPTIIALFGVSLISAWIFYFFKRNKRCLTFILLSTLFLGASLLGLVDKNFNQNSLHNLHYEDYIDFYGTLAKSPSLGQDKFWLLLKVERASFQKKEKKIKGNLRITVYNSSPSISARNLLVGDKIKVSACLTSSRGFRNFNRPSLNLYLKTQKIHRRAISKSPLLIEKIKSGKRFSLLRAISWLRQSLQQKIEEHFPSSAASLSVQGAVLEALLLGERNRLNNSTSRALQNAGIYHLMAISGAHIAIISFFFFSILKLFRVPERLSYMLLMPFLVFFALLVEGRPSVMRATIMALAYLLGKIIWSDVNLINTISISAFFLLLLNPFSLFNVGFQLTFAATLSIILFFPKIIKYLPRLPFRISEIFCLSLTAQLGIIPIVAAVFHRVTFSAIVLNYAALPLVAVIMAGGYIFLIFSFFSFWLSHLLAKFISLSINLLIRTSHSLDWLPFVSYRLPSPHLLTIISYFAFLLLFLISFKAKRHKLWLSFCFLAVFFILIYYPFPSSFSPGLKLTVLDVGQGESILVEFPGRKKMLIDGGGLQQETYDIGENVVSPFLWKKGIKKIDYLVLTHAHPDHLNGLRAVARNFKINEFWEALSPLKNKTYQEFKRLLPPANRQKRMFRGEVHKEGSTIISVLHPARQNPYVVKVDNDQSLVLRLTYGQTSFLLPGDIGTKAEKEILETGLEIQSQLLKSPHHGSKTSSSAVFLEKVKPQLVIISVGKGNRYGFPNKEVLARYKQFGLKIYRTDLDGAVEALSDGHKISTRTSVIR